MKKEFPTELDSTHSDVVRCVEQYVPATLRDSLLLFYGGEVNNNYVEQADSGSGTTKAYPRQTE